MSNIQIFKNDHFGSLNVLILEDEFYFNLNEVGELLGLSNPRMSIDVTDTDYVRKFENSIVSETYNRKLHNTGELFLTEAGLYRLLNRSNKPEAEMFQKWVNKEVLPSIRKTGSYSVAPKTTSELLLAQVQLLVELERRQLETEQTVKQQQGELNSLKSDVDHMIEVRETAKEQLEFLPLSENTSPEQTLRSKINQIIKAYVSLTGVSYPEAWDSVYKNLYYKYSISVRAIKPIKKGENNLSKLERKGHLEAVYTVVSEMLRDGK